MKTQILDDADAVAKQAARFIAQAAGEAILQRRRFVLALSGGRTPWVMLRLLAREAVSWSDVDIVQVDERVAADDSTDRNFMRLRESLKGSGLRDQQVHAMPVTSDDLREAADAYSATLSELAGWPPVLDLVHLGLGADGHTASLLPDDPVLEVVDRDVAITGPYQGHRRMSLTYPAINRARHILWVVTGADKASALARLRAGDRGIPAGRIRRDRVTLLADRAAAGELKADASCAPQGS